jgi:hypothetical protein
VVCQYIAAIYMQYLHLESMEELFQHADSVVLFFVERRGCMWCMYMDYGCDFHAKCRELFLLACAVYAVQLLCVVYAVHLT